MSDSKVFDGVTEKVFACVKTSSFKEHGTVYDPSTGNKGTATTKVPFIGTVVLDFDLDPSTAKITYTIRSKPGIVPASQIFDGIQSSINGCK